MAAQRSVFTALVIMLNASEEKIVAGKSDLVHCVTKIRAAQEVYEA
jgi:hypothetical protein